MTAKQPQKDTDEQEQTVLKQAQEASTTAESVINEAGIVIEDLKQQVDLAKKTAILAKAENDRVDELIKEVREKDASVKRGVQQNAIQKEARWTLIAGITTSVVAFVFAIIGLLYQTGFIAPANGDIGQNFHGGVVLILILVLVGVLLLRHSGRCQALWVEQARLETSIEHAKCVSDENLKQTLRVLIALNVSGDNMPPALLSKLVGGLRKTTD